jgi:hypothetical protein
MGNYKYKPWYVNPAPMMIDMAGIFTIIMMKGVAK